VAHYAALAVFVAACWGYGRAALTRLGAPSHRDAALETAMAVALGVGFFICAFQALAIAGVFRLGGVLILAGCGGALAAWQAPAWWREWRARASQNMSSLPWLERAALVVLALVALPALVAPLAPPAAFDELMYHLPYARMVAQTGALGIHDWLRYPWFPYNINLLYAGAMLVQDDVLPHLINGLTGALSVWMVYRLGIQYASRVIACAGAAIWLGLGDYSNALIDMGVALFVLAACVSLWWWRESMAADGRPAARWLCVAAFCLGVAAGSKYQALTFLPLFGLFVLWHDRRPKVLAIALLFFLIPCVYWFARNAIMTGDPFNPIGARLFGFTNWNAADYKNQLDDVRAHAAWPSAIIWPVLLAPFSPLLRRTAWVRAAVVFCAYSLVVWFVTSRYPRYMTASYPLIALMAAVGWVVFFRAIASGARKRLPAAVTNANGERPAAWSGAALMVLFVFGSLFQTATKVAAISPTSALREAFLRKNVPGYAAMHYLREHPNGRVYQVALSEAIYYGPDEVWGDTLGPWRYSDFLAAPADQMARKFASLGFGAPVVATRYVPILEAKPGFAKHFALLYEKDDAKAYRILAGAP
jgi:hypothetical protein